MGNSFRFWSQYLESSSSLCVSQPGNPGQVTPLSPSFLSSPYKMHGVPWWLSGEESDCQCRSPEFSPWVRKLPWRRKWQATPISLPGKSHGQRSQAGYSPWDHKESDLAEQLTTRAQADCSLLKLEFRIALPVFSAVTRKRCLLFSSQAAPCLDSCVWGSTRQSVCLRGSLRCFREACAVGFQLSDLPFVQVSFSFLS